MINTADGFSAWGKDVDGYSSDPKVIEETEKAYGYSKSGYNNASESVFDCKSDRGCGWWVDDGELVLKDPQYRADASFTVSSWIKLLTKYSDTAN